MSSSRPDCSRIPGIALIQRCDAHHRPGPLTKSRRAPLRRPAPPGARGGFFRRACSLGACSPPCFQAGSAKSAKFHFPAALLLPVRLLVVQLEQTLIPASWLRMSCFAVSIRRAKASLRPIANPAAARTKGLDDGRMFLRFPSGSYLAHLGCGDPGRCPAIRLRSGLVGGHDGSPCLRHRARAQSLCGDPQRVTAVRMAP